MAACTMRRTLALAAIVAITGTAIAVAGAAPEGWIAFTPGDCEAWRRGAIRQPAAAWSSLALAMAGWWIAATCRSLRETVVAIAAAAAGAAAFLAHAGGASWAARLDAAGVAVVTGALAALVWSASPAATAAGSLAILLAGVVMPGALEPLAAGFGVAAGIGLVLRRGRPRTTALAAALLAAGGALWWLGRSGGPWCSPGSLLQPHAGWHILAAAAIAATVAAARGPGTPERP